MCRFRLNCRLYGSWAEKIINLTLGGDVVPNTGGLVLVPVAKVGGVVALAFQPAEKGDHFEHTVYFSLYLVLTFELEYGAQMAYSP